MNTVRRVRSAAVPAARRALAGPSSAARPFSTAAPAAGTEKLWIFDTTLRDGEQSPGATLTGDEKVEIGKQLARLGVDICEAGFPIASQGDFEAVKRVALTAGHMTEGRPNGVPMRIAGLARANQKDIARCHEAVSHAPLHRIHTFLASSDIHLEHKLNITRAECLATASKMVAFARTLVDDIEFSPEDAGRSDREFLVELCQAVIEAGATTINLPDTVGYTLPQEYGNLFAYLIEKTPTGGRNVIWSTHCHNDLGLATANTLTAVQRGARQVEVTLNSLGERAGNTSLEEVVMALRVRPQHFPVYCDIDTRQIMRTSKMVASYTGISVQPNKAIVGANAFAHESGIHQHGMLKNASTYEIMTPESVGIEGGHAGRGSLVLGKHSGKAAYRQRLIELGYADIANDAEQLARIVEGAKTVADQKKTLSDQDLEALVGDRLYSATETWELLDLVVTSASKDSGKQLTSTATVTLIDRSKGEGAEAGTQTMRAAIGIGPVDATYKAILSVIGKPIMLTKYQVTKIEGGSGPDAPGNDALASVITQIKQMRQGDVQAAPMPVDFPGHMGATVRPVVNALGGNELGIVKAAGPSDVTYTGIGTSTDIIVASARAYIAAINRMIENEANEEAASKRRAKAATGAA